MAFRAAAALLLGALLFCSSSVERERLADRERELQSARMVEETARRAAAAALEQERRYSARLAQVIQGMPAQPGAIASESQGARGPYDDLIGALRARIEAGDVRVRRSAADIRITIEERLYFETGSAELSASGRSLLDQLAPALAKFPEHQIIAAGHADNNPILPPLRARYATNWELAAARAVTVARYLTERGGLAPRNVSAASYGEHQPSASNRTATGRAENRRIEIILVQTVTPAAGPQAERPRAAVQPRHANRPRRPTSSRRATPAAGAPSERPSASDSVAPEPRAPDAYSEEEVDLRR